MRQECIQTLEIGMDISDSATKTTQGAGGPTVETVSTGSKKGKK